MSNFNHILEQIESWSLFEIYRLQSALKKQLDDPAHNERIKQQLNVGMTISYFCSQKNTLVDAIITEIRKTWASVIDIQTGKTWNIKFYLINLTGINTSIAPKKKSGNLDRNALKIGDRVGWHSKSGQDQYGIVEKLNPKKALIALSSGERWTVPYQLLFLIMDGISVEHNPLCIEGEIINSVIEG